MNKQISFSWDIHLKCNYRCPYCWHFGKWDQYQNVYPGLKKLVETWKRIYNLYGECKIGIYGGEPSIYPEINDFLLELVKYHKVFVTTNLSLGFESFIDRLPEDLVCKVQFITSFHPMFADMNDFLKKAVYIKKKIDNTCVTYVAYPKQIEDMAKYKQIFNDNNINFQILKFYGEYNGKKYPEAYNDYEKEKVGIYESIVRDEDKTTIVVEKKEFVPKGKLCNAGYKHATISCNGDVRFCGGFDWKDIKNMNIGNIFDPNFKLMDKPIVCPAERCPCNEWVDLLVEK